MTVIGLALALIGPFGSYHDPFALRLIIWLGYCYIGYGVYAPIDSTAQRLAPVLELPAWGLRIGGVLLASVPMALAVWVLPQLGGTIMRPDLSQAVTHYFSVVLIGGLITVVFTLVQRRAGEGENVAPAAASEKIAPATLPPAVSGSRFLDRLPPELGSELIALEMEDHYVRAHTALGSELVLLRMRDAVEELDGIAGEQVHRSWWVARGAVADVKREGRNIRLVLDNGMEAPVARANVTPLKKAGWF